LYDVQGGPWSKVPGETIQHVSADRVEPRGTQEQTHTSSSSNSGIQTNMNRTLNTEDNNGTYDILMIHDSICKDIDINRLLRRTNRRGVKQTTYTVPEVQKFASENLIHASTIILHVGINDLKKMSADEAFIDYENVVKILMEKSNSVLLSLATPCSFGMLNHKVSEFNDKVYTRFCNMENVRISTNVNFSERGRLCTHLYKDAIRLSSEGVSVLAANIKRTLLGKG